MIALESPPQDSEAPVTAFCIPCSVRSIRISHQRERESSRRRLTERRLHETANSIAEPAVTPVPFVA